MKQMISSIVVASLILASGPLAAERPADPEPIRQQATENDDEAPPNRQFDLEVEPVAYLLRGAGITGGVLVDQWRFSLEIFGLQLPEFLHGNEGFDASVLGAEVHAEWFFADSPAGFFIGPEVGISNLRVTHRDSGGVREHLQFSVGLRGGYRWYTGLGDLYLSPQGGVVYTLNGRDLNVDDTTYESAPLPVTPFVTVGIGWSFGR